MTNISVLELDREQCEAGTVIKSPTTVSNEKKKLGLQTQLTINASTLGASLSLLSRLDSIKRGNRNRNEETLRSIPTQAGLDPVLLVPRPLRNCQNPRQTHISLPCIGEGYFFFIWPSKARSLDWRETMSCNCSLGQRKESVI